MLDYTKIKYCPDCGAAIEKEWIQENKNINTKELDDFNDWSEHLNIANPFEVKIICRECGCEVYKRERIYLKPFFIDACEVFFKNRSELLKLYKQYPTLQQRKSYQDRDKIKFTLFDGYLQLDSVFGNKFRVDGLLYDDKYIISEKQMTIQEFKNFIGSLYKDYSKFYFIEEWIIGTSFMISSQNFKIDVEDVDFTNLYERKIEQTQEAEQVKDDEIIEPTEEINQEEKPKLSKGRRK